MRRLIDLKKNGPLIKSLVKTYGAENVRVFGSVLRGQDKQNSDVDLLIDWEVPHSLFQHIELQQKLEDLLDAKVDLISAKTLHWFLRDRVLEEAVPL